MKRMKIRKNGQIAGFCGLSPNPTDQDLHSEKDKAAEQEFPRQYWHIPNHPHGAEEHQHHDAGDDQEPWITLS